MLKEKVIVVSGGAGMLGRSFCQAIASSHGTAVIADVDPVVCQQIRDELNQGLSTDASGAFEIAEMDITSETSIGAAIEDIRARLGRIDGFVNSAYPRTENYGREFFDVTYQDFCDNLGLHLGGYFATMKAFARDLSEHGGGSIVNIGSIYGVNAPRFEIYEGTSMTVPVEYAAIKSGLVHLTRYVAAYMKGSGVRVNCVSPGGVADGQPQSFLDKYNNQCLSKGMLDPEDVAGSVIFLLSEAARFINGQNLIVDDGWVL